MTRRSSYLSAAISSVLLLAILPATAEVRFGMVKDLYPGEGPGIGYNSIPSGTTLYFVEWEYGTQGAGLYRTEGTAATTEKIFNTSELGLHGYLPLNDILILSLEEPVHGKELWVSDGTAVGTRLLRDIKPGPGSSAPDLCSVFNGFCYFAANQTGNSCELWKTDGTDAGTQLVKTFTETAPTIDSYFHNFAACNGLLFFSIDETSQIWKTDGTTEGTVPVYDVYPNTQCQILAIAAGGTLAYFSVYRNLAPASLWATDGTGPGTHLLATIQVDMNNGNAWPPCLNEFLWVNGKMYFWAPVNNEPQITLWYSDGTAVGTGAFNGTHYSGLQLVGPESHRFSLAAVNNRLVFPGVNPTVGAEPFVLDTVNGTISPLKDINPGPNGSDPDQFVARDGYVYFAASDGTNKWTWRSDGTPDGTALYAKITPETRPWEPYFTTDRIYFSHDDGIHGLELWSIWDSAGLAYHTTGGGWLQVGQPFTLQTTVTNPFSDPTFQWFQNGAPVPGATNPIYEVPNAALDDSGNYCCHINDAGVNYYPNTVTLTVFPAQSLPATTPTATAILLLLFLAAAASITPRHRASALVTVRFLALLLQLLL